METNEISEQALELQIQVLEERNALLEKKIRRLTHRCQALERFYRENHSDAVFVVGGCV